MSAGWTIEADGLDLPVQIIGDPTLIALVLRNLLDNVRKHTKAGSNVKVSISTDGTLLFADNGPGLPARFPTSGFARFVRGNENSRSGSGLGLSICETAMRRMRGTFHMEPIVGGAAFRMNFSVDRSSNEVKRTELKERNVSVSGLT